MTQPHPQRCENKMTGNVITLSKDEYERLAAYRKRVIPYMCPDEAKDWQVFFDLVETRTHSSATEPAPERRSIDIAEMLAAVEQARKEEREKVLDAIEKWSDNEVYGVDDEGYDATPVVPYLGLEHTIKFLREGAQ